MPPPTFSGFSAEGLTLLRAIGGADRDHFEANKKAYDELIATPAKAFVDAMTAGLQDRISPLVDGQPKTNGSIAPINNDLRFNPDASPYKDHVLFKWWQGPDKKLAPTVWVRMSPTDVGFASGIALADLDRWRDAVGGDAGAELATAIDRLAADRDLDVAGQALKTVPKPYPSDHPRADLLRHKGFQVRWSEPAPKTIGSAAFVDHCLDRLDLVAPIHHWLVDQLG